MTDTNTWTLQQKTHSLKTAVDFIAAASQRGDLDEVKDLYALIAPTFDTMGTRDARRLQHMPLEAAAAQGHVEVVEYLIPLSVFDGTNHALNNAARNGHLNCIQLLASHYPTNMLSVALTEAACANHVDCVMELLKMNPPNWDDDYEVCLIWASANKNQQLLEYFYTRCNPDRALEISDWWEDEELEMLAHYHSPEGQRERLENIVKSSVDKRKSKI